MIYRCRGALQPACSLDAASRQRALAPVTRAVILPVTIRVH